MEQISILDKLFRFRAANHIIREIKHYIGQGTRVLDIGAGYGITASQIAKKLKADVSMVDVVDKHKVDLPFTLYDGEKLPFKDKSFDIALLIFVLHHADSQETVLKESKRVVVDKIIIYEDILTRNIFDRIDTFLHGFLFNRAWNLKNHASFKSEKEWRNLFEKLGLKVVKAYPLPIRARILYPVFRMQFVLQV